MLNITRLKYAVQALRELNKSRGELSKQLASLKARYTIREKVVDNLYGYYDMIASDYYAAFEGEVKFGQALEVMKEYMKEHQELLEQQLNALRNTLDKPLTPTDGKEKLEFIKSHVYYMKD